MHDVAAAIAVTAMALVYQCAETTRLARVRVGESPRRTPARSGTTCAAKVLVAVLLRWRTPSSAPRANCCGLVAAEAQNLVLVTL